MKTATVRDLRNSFSMLEAWLSEGEDIRIEKRGQPIGLLTAWRADPAAAGRLEAEKRALAGRGLLVAMRAP